ncbi:hypothetical protein FB45DRAFT_1000500 [Roridomyces roridus]|uniref:Uncharacterized protein n=1 Tax=Roridomyces roridus TaxID=1738132 RepID=A0AAD7FW40_9AGAR|nr:hypothetical protein FB45DRAFT_1000500 [Roridomyces roridus]
MPEIVKPLTVGWAEHKKKYTVYTLDSGMHEDGVDGVRTAKGALNGVGRGGMDGGRRRYPPWVNGVVERDEVLPGKDAIDRSNNDQRKEWKMLEGGFAAVVRSVVESGRGAKRRRPGSVITVTPLSQESVLISQAHQYFTLPEASQRELQHRYTSDNVDALYCTCTRLIEHRIILRQR